jgi:hypothetical protein
MGYISLEEEYNYKEGPEVHQNHPDNWDICPVCKNKPKVWTFDNGRYAKCDCYEEYTKLDCNGEEIVSAVSVGDWHRGNKGNFSDYPFYELRDNWNKRCLRLDLFRRRTNSINDLLK